VCLEVVQVLGTSSHQLHATGTYNQEKITKYPMNRRLGAPHSQSGYCREEKPSCPCWALQHDPSVFHPDSLVIAPAFAMWTETVILPSFIHDLKASNEQEQRINKIIPSVITSRAV